MFYAKSYSRQNSSLMTNSIFRVKKILKFVTIIFLCLNFSLICVSQSLAPCQEECCAVFPGGPTLCQSITDFSPDITITNGTYASSLHVTLWPINSSYFNSKDVLITGIFYIDTPIAFYNCRIKLASGAQIIVLSQIHNPIYKIELLAFRTKFFSCDDMWKGMVFGQGTRCRLYSCKIEDAQYALTIGKSVSVALISNLFNRNFVSIRNAEGNTTLPFLYITKNVFNCTSALSDYYDLDFPCCNEDPVTFAGILLNNCTSSIGFYKSNNTFKNLNYGIYAYNSTVSIKGCNFFDAQQSTTIPELFETSPIWGSGVAGKNSYILILGDEFNRSSYFNKAGIMTRFTSIKVSYADFDNCWFNASENYGGETVSIEKSHFNLDSESADPFAIVVSRPYSSGDKYHAIISGNKLEIQDLDYISGGGISFSGNYGSTDYAIVSYDTIIAKGVNWFNAINLFHHASENAYILNNRIELSSEDSKITGIRVGEGHTTGHIVKNNTISCGTSLNTNESYGIQAINAQNITYCNNLLENTNTGLAFKGNCNPSFISQNEMNEHAYGMIIEDYNGMPGVFGEQIATLNLWLNDIYTKAANNTSSMPALSPYFINNDDLGDPTINPTNIIPSSGWFIPTLLDHNICSAAIEPFVNGFDSLIILSENSFENLAEPVKFYLEKRLIFKLLSDENLADAYSTYLSSKNSDTEYLLAHIEIDFKEAMQMDLLDQQNIDDFTDTIKVRYDSIFLYNEVNYNNIDSLTYTEGRFLDSISSKLSNIAEIFELQQEIKKERFDLLIEDLDDIQFELNLIEPRSSFDSNYVFIYSKLIDYIKFGYLSYEDMEALNKIASNDADSSLANQTAQATFNLCYDQDLISKDSPNDIEEIEDRNHTNIVQAKVVGEDNISISIDTIISGNLHVYDFTGRCVFKKTLNDFQGDVEIDMPVYGGIFYWVFSSINSRKSGVILVQ